MKKWTVSEDARCNMEGATRWFWGVSDGKTTYEAGSGVDAYWLAEILNKQEPAWESVQIMHK